ncbi:hypothetical protein [Streptomyces mirabilis]|uniref:hypothetical protein n=1 Tax=Streptomyces mirabilis TaxID=68239 RepID=UPI00339E16A8
MNGTTIGALPRAKKKEPERDARSRPEDQDEATEADSEAGDDGPDEGLRPAA